MVGICGQPIDEAIVGSGPFVMNNGEEIRQEIADYQSGKDRAYAVMLPNKLRPETGGQPQKFH